MLEPKLHCGPRAGEDIEHLPPQVLRLAAREREVATIIYVHGACTAKDVQALLSTPLSNGAVRSMLLRLIKKGLLKRSWGKRGPCQGHVYFPAIAPEELQERALKDLAEKYFGGSLLGAAMSALKLLREQPGQAGSNRQGSPSAVPFELPLEGVRPSAHACGLPAVAGRVGS